LKTIHHLRAIFAIIGIGFLAPSANAQTYTAIDLDSFTQA
jgi:hypothetical protein